MSIATRISPFTRDTIDCISKVAPFFTTTTSTHLIVHQMRSVGDTISGLQKKAAEQYPDCSSMLIIIQAIKDRIAEPDTPLTCIINKGMWTTGKSNILGNLDKIEKIIKASMPKKAASAVMPQHAPPKKAASAVMPQHTLPKKAASAVMPQHTLPKKEVSLSKSESRKIFCDSAQPTLKQMQSLFDKLQGYFLFVASSEESTPQTLLDIQQMIWDLNRLKTMTASQEAPLIDILAQIISLKIDMSEPSSIKKECVCSKIAWKGNMLELCKLLDILENGVTELLSKDAEPLLDFAFNAHMGNPFEIYASQESELEALHQACTLASSHDSPSKKARTGKYTPLTLPDAGFSTLPARIFDNLLLETSTYE